MNITPDEIERIEKTTLRWIFQAALDFGMDAHEVFLRSPDEVSDIAEDVVREMLDSLPGHNISQRIYGTVDYKRARYVITEDKALRQALFVDSKGEQTDRNATIQRSQTSMRIKQERGGKVLDEKGDLPPILEFEGQEFLTTTCFLHFKYHDYKNGQHVLDSLKLICLPNGRLQEKYNPSPEDTFWMAGRDAPSRGEKFRARVSFDKLREKAGWRVQELRYDKANKRCTGDWCE